MFFSTRVNWASPRRSRVSGNVTFLPPPDIWEEARLVLFTVSFVVAVKPSGSRNTTPPKESTEFGE
ncbi:hypothetical protein AXI59_17830 [Bacillus nakamurai]|nr:hypothetical protein AXI59_17830 [Bacillus nakamurai]